MKNFSKTVIASLFFAGLALATPASASTFDGSWSVQIASSNGTCCPSGTSLSIGISNGQVASSSGMMTASGRVAEAGNISVTLANGMKRAVGFGHLSGASGSGTWHGGPCSGTWTAQKI
jgi:hypothetical protein